MISYAQNAEDVVLARALPGRTGFYVDVGAGDPEIASVTKHFYDLGWRGINIEPRSSAIARLEDQRPADINLKVAAGATDGEGHLYIVDADPDMSTTDADDLELLRERGYDVSAESVLVRTLDSIFEEHAVPAIDFLKIDVEGGEADVLAGIDLDRWQPRVIVIESTKPWSHERNDASWRPALESHGYRARCFDGVNLFFARENDRAVGDALVPASVLDDYQTAASVAVDEELDRLRTYIAKLEDELDRHKVAQAEVGEYVRSLEAGLDPSRTIAPVISLSTSPPPRESTRRAPPPQPARLAIIGTPRVGNTWIRRVLADALATEERAVHHPADIDWDDLPDRVVIQLHWQRSRLLERALGDRGFRVISPARHPLDVLLSILMFSQRGSTREWLGGLGGDESLLPGSGAGDPAFMEWALSARARALLSVTPGWWSTPTTQRVRYEDLCADPDAQFLTLLERCGLDPRKDPSSVLAANSPARINAMSDGVHVWRASPGAWRETLTREVVDRLMDAHRDVVISLGYDPDDRTLA